MTKSSKVILIGYAGHGFVAADIFQLSNYTITGYCDMFPKEINPFDLQYLGSEKDEKPKELFRNNLFFVAIGDNHIRQKVYTSLESAGYISANAIHPKSILSSKVSYETGIMVASNACVNPETIIKKGAICNTGSIVEHECKLESFSHVAPGAVLAGSVSVGKFSFVGANSVVKEGINVGDNVIIGAGSVVIADIPDNVVVVGNPARIIKRNI